VEQGVALRRRGERTAARGALERGMDLAARCEARPLTMRARTELQALGARPRRLMFSGIDGLTATERRVAGMAAGGLSNREIAQSLFVTAKTVESHLAGAYRKLEVAPRRDLPIELARPERTKTSGGTPDAGRATQRMLAPCARPPPSGLRPRSSAEMGR